MSIPTNPALLEAVRARIRAGDTMTEAARHCGITPDRARGLIVRHGRGEAPAPVVWREGVLRGSPAPGGCCWPTSAGRPWLFCDRPHEPGGAYCREHHVQSVVRVRAGQQPFVMTWIR